MTSWMRRATEAAGSIVRRYTDPDQTSFVTLRPEGSVRGRALVAHIVESFLLRDVDRLPTSHTHFGEALELVGALLDLGYVVDVISYRNRTFVPRVRYDLFISARVNFELIARRLADDCIKVVHLDTAHWLTNNAAAIGRCRDVQARRGVTLASYRPIEESWAIEHADYATMKGNEATYQSYAFANKTVFQVPNPAIEIYPAPDEKDFERVRHRFMWLGSRGLVHKGLDLVLETFARLPQLELTVCGPLAADERFQHAFRRELYETPNIRAYGWIDVAAPQFQELTEATLSMVYPSCAEGCAGSVVTSMHAGLVPIVSDAAGIDVDEAFGVSFSEVSADAVQRAVVKVAALPARELKVMAMRAWEFARANHVRSRYREVYRSVLETIVERHGRLRPGFVRMADTPRR